MGGIGAEEETVDSDGRGRGYAFSCANLCSQCWKINHMRFSHTMSNLGSRYSWRGPRLLVVEPWRRLPLNQREHHIGRSVLLSRRAALMPAALYSLANTSAPARGEPPPPMSIAATAFLYVWAIEV